MVDPQCTLTVAATAAVLALTGCGTVRLGSAAVTDTDRISSATVAGQVSNLNQAHQADKAKVQLQFPAAQTPQVVLSWLLRFKVREQMAHRYGITVTHRQVQAALASATAQAKQSRATLTDLAVANGVPPDQIGELGRYIAIQNAVLARLDGGQLPTAQAALQILGNQFNTSQCRAAKSLGIQVNPQFGELDYRQTTGRARAGPAGRGAAGRRRRHPLGPPPRRPRRTASGPPVRPGGAVSGQVVLLVTSPAVRPGLLSWPAWQTLAGASQVLVASAEHPLLPGLDEAGIGWAVLPGAAGAGPGSWPGC